MVHNSGLTSAARVSEIVVAVLTYRRPQHLAVLLPLLLDQVGDSPLTAEVLVVDNDPDAGAKSAVTALQGPIRYVHEPTPGISAARNRALDEARGARAVVFIDDDERPNAKWLVALVEHWLNVGTAAVTGPVVFQFETPLDPWLSAGKFFNPRRLPTGASVAVTATNNLLLDLHWLDSQQLRFDNNFGLSGGEDSLLTQQIVERGGVIEWNDEAVVTEIVPASRTTHRWVLQRAFREGNSESRVSLQLAKRRGERLRQKLRLVGGGLTRLTVGGVRAGIGTVCGRIDHQAQGMRTVMRGAGFVLGAYGYIYNEYDRSAPGSAEITVLSSFPAPRPTDNPYITQLAHALRATPEIKLTTFTWRAALTGRFDVFHVHWPEILVGGRRGLKKLVRQVLFVIMLLRFNIHGTAIVRTMHNLYLPDEISQVERILLTWFDRLTVYRVVINPETPVLMAQPHSLIPHGHYRNWFADFTKQDPIVGRFAFVGLIRRYKNVESLVAAFRETADTGLSLSISGNPSNEAMVRTLRELGGNDARIFYQFAFLDEGELVRAMTEAEIVVLPYRHMHNSGAVLTSLSLDRPVLVPDNEVNRRLAEEVGPGWIQMFSGELDADDLRRSLDTVRSLGIPRPDVRPDLTAREWAKTGSEHARAYRQAVETLRGRRRSRPRTPVSVFVDWLGINKNSR